MFAKEWYSVELPVQYAGLFKYYLRENDIYFEPSEAGQMIYFKCLMDEKEYDLAESLLELINCVK